MSETRGPLPTSSFDQDTGASDRFRRPAPQAHQLWFENGDTSLSVRSFRITEHVSGLFQADLVVRSESAGLALDAFVGRGAGLTLASGYAHVAASRVWEGIVSHMAQVEAEPTGLSTYEVRIVPSLWRLTQRRNHRIFQHLSIPDIAAEVLRGFGLTAQTRLDLSRYPKLEYKVQYGESDYHFLHRLLAEAGVSFAFEQDPSNTRSVILVLSDEPQSREPVDVPIPFVDKPNESSERAFVTKMCFATDARPGSHVVRDVDFRRPAYPLFGEAPPAPLPETPLEQFHYLPGAFVVETGRGGDTPVADDRGVARHDARAGQTLARTRSEAERATKRSLRFETNVLGLAPNTVFRVEGHPHPDFDVPLFVTAAHIDGGEGLAMTIRVEATFANVPYRPLPATPKPAVHGIQSATVVGAPGEEIHTDEFGRVRVQFPWDRLGTSDDRSSCWMRVSEGWAGTGYGLFTLPRVGQEVLVAFLAGDPDQPVVVGRVFNATQRVPYKLPDHKTRSTWQSRSSPGGTGYNEIMFEDLKGEELVFEQAEKDRRRLVKHDETITVQNHREKLVKGHEYETTRLDRVEVTDNDRTELTRANRTTVIGSSRSTLVKSTSDERVEGALRQTVASNMDVRVGASLREDIGGDRSATLGGSLRTKLGGTWSVDAGGDHVEHLGGRFAVEAGGEVHFKTGTTFVLDVGQDFTIKAPGGFIRVNAEGVTIKGNLVKINSGGSPGSGSAIATLAPEKAEAAVVRDPEAPEPDDVSKSAFSPSTPRKGA